jgi:hypothetical protein
VVISRSRNDCAVMALANAFGRTYEEIAIRIGYTRGKGSKLQLAQRVAIELSGGEWSPHLTSDTGLLVLRRGGSRWHMAYVKGGRILLERGEWVPLGHVVGSWSVVRWLSLTGKFL